MSTLLEYRTITFLVWNHQSNVAITDGSCTTLWAVPDVLSSECKSTYLEAWGVGSWSQRCPKAEAQHNIDTGCCFAGHQVLFSSDKNDTFSVPYSSRLMSFFFALCERHWTWKEPELIFSEWTPGESLWPPFENAHLEKVQNTRRHLPSTNCWLSQSWGVSTPVAAKIICIMCCRMCNDYSNLTPFNDLPINDC